MRSSCCGSSSSSSCKWSTMDHGDIALWQQDTSVATAVALFCSWFVLFHFCFSRTKLFLYHNMQCLARLVCSVSVGGAERHSREGKECGRLQTSKRRKRTTCNIDLVRAEKSRSLVFLARSSQHRRGVTPAPRCNHPINPRNATAVPCVGRSTGKQHYAGAGVWGRTRERGRHDNILLLVCNVVGKENQLLQDSPLKR